MGFALPSDYRPGHTYDDYCLWEGNWELIDGIPHAMSPQPSGKHQHICFELAGQLREALTNCSECTASLPMDWKVDESTVLQPDLFVACYPFLDKKFIDRAPALVVEVLSPSTRVKDMTIKRSIYLDQGVKWYLIIDPDTEEYMVLQLVQGEYVEAAKGHDGQFQFSFDTCEAKLDFSRIWA